MTNDIYQDIVDHFSDANRKNTVLEIMYDYDLTVEEAYIQIERDSAAASQAVKDLGLDYTIDAKHYSKVKGGTEIVNSVDILWKFWK